MQPLPTIDAQDPLVRNTLRQVFSLLRPKLWMANEDGLIHTVDVRVKLGPRSM